MDDRTRGPTMIGANESIAFEAIFDNAAVGIAFTRNRVIERCNERWASLFGYTVDQLLGQKARILYFSDDAYAELSHHASPVLSKSIAFRTELEFRRADGTGVWCSLYGRAIDPAHSADGTVWIADDISELRQTALREKQANRELEAVFEAAVHGIAVVRHRVLQRCNSRFEEIFGYQRGEMLDRSARLWYLSDEDFERLGASAYPDLLAGGIHRREQVFRRRDGSAFWGRISGRAFDNKQPHEGTVWLLEDITERRAQEARLTEIRAQLEAIFETAGVGVALLRNRVLVQCNRQFEQLFGCAPGEMLGRSTRTWYLSEDDFVSIGEVAYAEMAKTGFNRREQMLVKKDGSTFWGSLNGRTLDMQDPQSASVWIIDDVTAQRKQQEWLREALDEQEMIFQNAAVGIVLIRQALIQRCNQRFDAIFGLTAGAMLGRTLNQLFANQTAFTALQPDIEQALNRKEVFIGEFEGRHSDGSHFWFRGTAHRVRDLGVIWIVEDITERRRMQEAILLAQNELEQRVKHRTAELADTNARLQAEVFERMQAEERVWHLAHHDPLTGLPNRSLLHDRMARSIMQSTREGGKTALIFVDLDNFKPINDQHGHEVGDQYLKAIAERFCAAVRAADTVARFGGDEFVILLHGIHSQGDVETVCEKLLECLRLPITIDALALQASASIGASVYPDDANDAPALLRHADTAMYAVKTGGRNDYRLYAITSP